MKQIFSLLDIYDNYYVYDFITLQIKYNSIFVINVENGRNKFRSIINQRIKNLYDVNINIILFNIQKINKLVLIVKKYNYMVKA